MTRKKKFSQRILQELRVSTTGDCTEQHNESAHQKYSDKSDIIATINYKSYKKSISKLELTLLYCVFNN